MTQSPPQPTGQADAQAGRIWYREKRFIIPVTVVSLFIAIDLARDGDDAPAAGSGETSQVEMTTSAADPSAAATEEAAAAGTVAQQNALRSAEDNLDVMAFSRTGLIAQLQSEGHSTDDATWAVGRVPVDWNDQAARAAEEYSGSSSFSRSELIDLLISDVGFTPEQAEYGVSQTGL